LVGIITRLTCKYRTGFTCLVGILIAVYSLWVLGGLLGVIFANARPDFFRQNFVGVPAGRREMLEYAWVGGSIWGEEFGGLLAVIVGLIVFCARWRIRWSRMVRN
jgi:hypothetical protein